MPRDTGTECDLTVRQISVTGSMTSMDGLAGTVIALAGTAGRMMLGTSPRISVSKGSKENYATETDLSIQAFLKKELLSALPGSVFLGEEGTDRSRGELVWVVDPIDGTVNYARGLSMSVVSIALVDHGTPVLGVVLNPYLGETYHAEAGRGAYLNGVRIHVSDTPRENALVSTAWCAYEKELAHDSFLISETLHRECMDIRRFGTAAYEMCLLAKGSVDMYFEMLLRPWDYAASSLIVKEAGGSCSSLDGPLDLFDQCPVLAANSADNLEYLRETVISVAGDRRPEGSIWGDGSAR